MKSSLAGLTLEGREWRLSDHLGPDGRLVPVAAEVIATASTTGLPVPRCEGLSSPAVNPAERMIPLLPCRSMDDQLAFYESLGFEVTYRQKAPNVYASVQRGLIELHFFVMKGYDPAGSYSTCYVMVPTSTALCRVSRRAETHLGRIPTRGIPRIGVLRDMSYGVRQFLMTDPGGNTIRIGQPSRTPPRSTDGRARASRRRSTRPVLLADSKGDPETAARVLDGALSVTTDAPARHSWPGVDPPGGRRARHG